MRTKDHPSFPSVITCCFFSSLKTLLMPREPIRAPFGVNVPSSAMAGFQLTLYGRFWVTAEDRRPSGSHSERVLSRISPAQSVYRMMEVTSGKKPVAPEILGTTSVHLRSGNFDGFLCKRHQQKHLVFFPTCFASRGPRVRFPPRPPTFFFSTK